MLHRRHRGDGAEEQRQRQGRDAPCARHRNRETNLAWAVGPPKGQAGEDQGGQKEGAAAGRQIWSPDAGFSRLYETELFWS